MFPPRSQIETLGKEVMNMVDQKPDDMRLRWYCCAEILREPKITLKTPNKKRDAITLFLQECLYPPVAGVGSDIE